MMFIYKFPKIKKKMVFIMRNIKNNEKKLLLIKRIETIIEKKIKSQPDLL